MNVTHLTEYELAEVLKRINQPEPLRAARICMHLASNPQSSLAAVSAAVGGKVNLSDTARKEINPRISDLRLMVGCEKPVSPAYQKYKETCSGYQWSFYRLT